MTTEVFTPEGIIALLTAQSEQPIARVFSYTRNRKLIHTYVQVFAGQNTADGPNLISLTAGVNLANMDSERTVMLSDSTITELPRDPQELWAFFDKWLDENTLRFWNLAAPVLCSSDQEGTYLTLGDTHPGCIWPLMIVQQRIGLGLGPNSPAKSCLMYRQLSGVVKRIQNKELEPFGLTL